MRAEVQKWVIYDGKFAGAVKVETKGSKVVVYKADGSKVVEQIEDFKFWFDGIPDMNVGISDKEKKAIAGLADVLGGVPSPTQTKPIGFVQKAADELADPIKQSAKAETPAVSQGLAPVLKKNGRLVDDIAGRVNGLKNSLTRGCSDANSCKNLIKYLQESVDPIKSKLSELQRAFAQATGNTDVEAFYKYLANDSETPKYIKDFLNNTELRNFVLNNGTVPGFNKIIGEMLPRYGWEDLAKILKSDIPKD